MLRSLESLIKINVHYVEQIFSDINSAIIETEQFIKNIHTDGIKIIEEN